MAMGHDASVGEGRRETFAPRIYYFHPLLAGPRSSWPRLLRRCRELGFDHVLTAPLFAPGATGDLFLTADHEKVHPALDGSLAADEFTADFARQCRDAGLNLLVDLVVGRVARDACLVLLHPDWFSAHSCNGQTVDPRGALPEPAAAYLRFEAATVEAVVAWWIGRLSRLVRAGVTGFCCSQPQLVPAAVWRRIIAALEQGVPEIRFLARTPGLSWPQIATLRGSGFDGTFSSLPWWDGRASWLVEEHALLRGVGAVICSPEVPFGPRLARRFAEVTDPTALYRHMARRAAALGDGILVPMGFEYAASDDMDARQTSIGEAWPAPPPGGNLDLSPEVREANALSEELARFRLGGEMRSLTDPGEQVTALLRCEQPSARQASAAIVVMVNSDLRHEQPAPIELAPLPAAAGAALLASNVVSADRAADAPLAAGEIRVLRAQKSNPIKVALPALEQKKLAKAPRIVIDNIAPSVDGGQFAAKRVIGEAVIIEADVFADGHEVLGVELLWRSAERKEWSRLPMRLLNNDRWRATIVPQRIGRYEFTLEAWIDRYGTLARDLEIKRAAGAELDNELAEARRLLERAKGRLACSSSKVVASALAWLDDASVDASLDILLARDLREVMYEASDRPFKGRGKPPLPLEIDRPAALFGAWYELFPRSASATPGRHGTLGDVIARLPALQEMGFDVLYLPPIHPIGTTNRKGKNNALHAAPDDVGSPYAIGSSEGGHTAIHPALGTIEDFRRLREAAAAHGIELALDFAIQCSPDHPWLKEHPEWFSWRPDGSIRYAENPPKKYEDIVNLDFYAEAGDARPVGRACATWCCSGSTKACEFFASTIRTPSRCRSGNG